MQAHVARIMTRPLLSLLYTLLIQLQAFLLVTLLYLTTWLSFCFFSPPLPSLYSTILHTLCACASYSNYDPSFIHPTAIRFCSYTTSGASLCLNSTCCHDNLCFPLLFLTPCGEALAYSRTIYPQP